MSAVLFIYFIFFSCLCIVNSALDQDPEINDQFEESNHTEVETRITEHVESNTVLDDVNLRPNNDTEAKITDRVDVNETVLVKTNKTNEDQSSFIVKVYMTIRRPIVEFMEIPKVNSVLKNIGTCIVNGAMEIVSFYFPAPLIPLIASAAGMVIPFEPVVMLRKRMPVTSYRRAFKTAVNTFMGTFDRFKASDEDPYMTKRFNRRFMQDKGVDD